MTATFFPTHAHTIPAPMGGGWIVPDTERGECVLRSFFGEQADFIDPIQETGWIIEPYQVTDLADYLQDVQI